MSDLPKTVDECHTRILGIMERNQELYTQNTNLRDWKLEVTKRIKVLGRRRPSIALDQLDVLIDDVHLGRKGLSQGCDLSVGRRLQKGSYLFHEGG